MSVTHFLLNGFWLLVPILAFNVVFARSLPPAFQSDVFDRAIPRAVAWPENALRGVVFVVPALLSLEIRRGTQVAGLVVYGAGVLAYFASWAALIRAPDGAWAARAPGFLAPAYTPAAWLVGIALACDRLVFDVRAYRPWMFVAASAAFLAFHNAHVALVFRRQRGAHARRGTARGASRRPAP